METRTKVPTQKEPMMDALSKLSEKWKGAVENGYVSNGTVAMSQCAAELDAALAALRPVIEKLVEAGQAMRAENYAIGSTNPQAQNWDAALENWRKASS
jgi:hypothetical protein